MKNGICKPLVLSATFLLTTPALAVDASYPEGYRQWTHVKTLELKPGHPLYEAVGGIHHLYANSAAIKGYRSGHRFTDGAVIVFDLFEAKDAGNATAEGARKAILVMRKDAKRYSATGGWGYQVYDPGSRQGKLDAKAQAECHACHQAQEKQGFVFSAWRD
jgi:hypothetical protein